MMTIRIVRAILALALLGILCGSAGAANVVPTAISYQGKLTTDEGKPLPDRDYGIVFNLYADEQSKDPIWSAKTEISTVGGVFTAVVEPPVKLIEECGDLWIATEFEGTALLPKAKLQSVPFAIRAATADTAAIANTVPNGSITSVKLAADVVFARAPYLTGVKSGLPATSSVVIKMDGVALSPSAKLAVAYEESRDVVWYQDGEDRFLRARPGAFHSTPIVLRRPISSNKDWIQLAIGSSIGRTSRYTWDIALMYGGQVVCNWAGANGFVSKYTVRLTDDGLPVEQIEVSTEGPLTRTVTSQLGSKPIGSGLQSGLKSEQSYGTTYKMSADGVDVPNVTVASDTGLNVEIIEYDDGDHIIHKRPGRMHTSALTVRTNPTLPSIMHDWWLGVANGIVERKDLGLSLALPAGAQPIADLTNAWPSSYSLKLGDDGLIYEEYELVYEEVTVPAAQ